MNLQSEPMVDMTASLIGEAIVTERTSRAAAQLDTNARYAMIDFESSKNTAKVMEGLMSGATKPIAETGGTLPLDAVTGIVPNMAPRKTIGELPLDVLQQEGGGAATATGGDQEGSAVKAWKDMSQQERAAYNQNRLGSAAVTSLGKATIEPTQQDQRIIQLQEQKKK